MSKWCNQDYLEAFPSLGTTQAPTTATAIATQAKVAKTFDMIIKSITKEFKSTNPNQQIIVDLEKTLTTLISENSPLIITKQLKDTISVFVDNKYHITLNLTKALNDIITDRITEFDLDKLLSQYVTLGISPNEAIYTTWLGNFIHKNTSKELHNSIWLHEKLSITPSEDFINQWITKTTHLINTMTAKEALGSLWSLSSMQTINKIATDIDLNQIKTTLTNRINIRQLSTEKNDIKHKLFTTDYMNNQTILTSEQRHTIITSQKCIKPTTSKLQNKAFKKLFPTAEEQSTLIEEAWIKELAIRVDGYVPTKKLIIQIDGNNHYTTDFNGDPCINFQTQVNTKLLENLGYKVIRISTYEIGKKGWDTIYKEQINSLPDIITELEPAHDFTDNELSETTSYDGDIDNILSILSNEENVELNILGATSHPDFLDPVAHGIL